MMRIIRAVDYDGKLHALLAMAVHRSTHYPAVMRRARTVRNFKDGDVQQIGNWRPITVFMSQRIVSIMFERRMRKFVSFSADGIYVASGMLLKYYAAYGSSETRKDQETAVPYDTP